MARAAEGACQRVAKWAGAGHMVFPESAGLAVPTTPPAAPDAAAAAPFETYSGGRWGDRRGR